MRDRTAAAEALPDQLSVFANSAESTSLYVLKAIEQNYKNRRVETRERDL